MKQEDGVLDSFDTIDIIDNECSSRKRHDDFNNID